jgi:hypothetical protein
LLLLCSVMFEIELLIYGLIRIGLVILFLTFFIYIQSLCDTGVRGLLCNFSEAIAAFVLLSSVVICCDIVYHVVAHRFSL